MASQRKARWSDDEIRQQLNVPAIGLGPNTMQQWRTLETQGFQLAQAYCQAIEPEVDPTYVMDQIRGVLNDGLRHLQLREARAVPEQAGAGRRG
jgi:hypothetical protein